MSGNSDEEVKSVDQTTTANESIDKSLSLKPEKESYIVVESKGEATIDVNPTETHQPIGLQFEKVQEREDALKETTRATDFTKDENVAEDVKETTTKQEISNTGITSLKGENITQVENTQEKESSLKETMPSIDSTKYENVDDEVQETNTKEELSDAKATLLKDKNITQVENTQEKESSLKDTTPSIDSTKDENVADVVQERITKEELSDAKATLLKDQNITPVENTQEKESSLKDTTPSIDSTKDENVADVVQERITKEKLSNTRITSLKDQNITPIKNTQEKESSLKETTPTIDSTKYENVDDEVQETNTKEELSDAKATLLKDQNITPVENTQEKESSLIDTTPSIDSTKDENVADVVQERITKEKLSNTRITSLKDQNITPIKNTQEKETSLKEPKAATYFTNDENVAEGIQETTIKEEIPNTKITSVKYQNITATANTEEKESSLKEKKPAIYSAKDENAADNVKEISTKEEILNTKTTSLISSEIPAKEIKESSKDEHAEHVTYIEDGTAIYTDPKTNYQYKWCTKENNWIPIDVTTSADAYENEHYKWCSETKEWIPKQTQVTETEHYKWDADKKQWVEKVKDITNKEQANPAEIVYDIDEDGQRTYTDKDGMVFFWDVEKNAWFPKIDDDFMARYQMNYGFIDNTSESEREKEKHDLEAAMQKEKELAKMIEEAKANDESSEETIKQGLKRKQPQEPPKWFEIDPSHNTKVYVSNLPLDITLDEFADFMGKCGMIMRDPQTQKYKIKLYTESDGQIKGDGLCDYIKVESVELALKILDEYDLRGHKIRVQRAQFEMRGEYNPALKPKRKKKDKEKLAKIKEKLFDWRPEKMRGERSKHEKTVIIKNLFHPELFEKEVQLILDYQNDLREECSKCGTVRKVVIYDRHSEGVAQVNMSTPEEADLVIQMMHGRFFGQRKLAADHWDGKTKYKIEETEDEIQKRLNKWDQYLETEENKKTDLHQEEKESTRTETQKDKELLGEESEKQSILEMHTEKSSDV